MCAASLFYGKVAAAVVLLCALACTSFGLQSSVGHGCGVRVLREVVGLEIFRQGGQCGCVFKWSSMRLRNSAHLAQRSFHQA
uniref:Secreted protein n=1 Tax=Ascaris lumbricoides TaxID=6252 RepID=A0A0M3HR63_ASCLU